MRSTIHPINFLFASILLLVVSCGLIESENFELATNSPLPKWFTKPDNIQREKIIVRINTYEAYSSEEGIVTITIQSSNGSMLKKAKGSWVWHKSSVKKHSAGDRTPPNRIVLKINGTEEIYEQSVDNNILKIITKST